MKTITICIPAHNEESNIKKHLQSVLAQKENGYKIEEIIVLSDGSTDKTVAYAKEVKDKRINILDFKERKGKSYHLNTFPKLVNSDILVMFDADVILEGSDVIEKLIAPIINDARVGLVSGNFQHTEARNFLQKAIKSTINVYEILRQEWQDGHNPFGCTGRIMALSKDYYKVMFVPHTMVLNDIYTYFDCVSRGFKFRHVKSVKVYYQLPSNIKDYLNQFKRFCVGSSRMEKIFGDLYQKEYAVPKDRVKQLMIDEFKRHPIHCGAIFLLNKIGKLIAKKEAAKMDGMWDVVYSTKSLSTN